MRKVYAQGPLQAHHSPRAGSLLGDRFSWDSNQPTPGVPVDIHARWVAEGLYRMWRGAGARHRFSYVTHATAGQHTNLRVGPVRLLRGRPWCDPPKNQPQEFRFPFVAFRSGGACASGAGPRGPRGERVVDHSSAALACGGGLYERGEGIFEGRPRRRGGGPLRAASIPGRRAPLPSVVRTPTPRVH